MRYYWLHQIELRLRERSITVDIRSVIDLRQLYPNLPSPLDLERFAGEVLTADLEDWATVPVKSKKGDRPKTRKSRITYAEIRERRSNGESLESIGFAAGISGERIRQICSMP